MKNQELFVNPALSALVSLRSDWPVEIAWSEQTHKSDGGRRLSAARKISSGLVAEDFSSTQPVEMVLQERIGRYASTPPLQVFMVLYADDRGVSRMYEMSFSDASL